jgi:glycerophosphoryl diester phosphodiesterase
MVLRIGHRGAAGYEPENTLRSFRKAIELKADMVELDVHVCSSGEVVVIHDDTVDRTTDGIGKVCELTLGELKRLDAGSGERIPTLEEVIRLIDGAASINIELKGQGTAEPVHKLTHGFLDEGWKKKDFLISSFNVEELAAFMNLSEIRIGLLYVQYNESILDTADQINAFSLNPYYKGINRNFINNTHNKGLKVYPWTVNDPSEIAVMKALNIDGVISDYPDRI